MFGPDGDGVLALWNGVDPLRQEEYELWHTREHVPERLSVPGMLWARRYVRSDGDLPHFLTIYAMRDTGVLRSPDYVKLLDEPTPWSRSMRPSFRGFMRLCCRREWSMGGGIGGCLGALMLPAGPLLQSDTLHDMLAGLLAGPCLVTAHFLIHDESVPDVPFKIGGEPPDVVGGGVILLESHDDALLAAVAPELGEGLAALGVREAAAGFTRYRLAYALDRDRRDGVVAIVGPTLLP